MPRFVPTMFDDSGDTMSHALRQKGQARSVGESTPKVKWYRNDFFFQEIINIMYWRLASCQLHIIEDYRGWPHSVLDTS